MVLISMDIRPLSFPSDQSPQGEKVSLPRRCLPLGTQREAVAAILIRAGGGFHGTRA